MKLTFGRGMFIIDAINTIAIHDQLQCFVEPTITGILCRATAMNQLRTSQIEIFIWIRHWNWLIQTHKKQWFCDRIYWCLIHCICKWNEENWFKFLIFFTFELSIETFFLFLFLLNLKCFRISQIDNEKYYKFLDKTVPCVKFS